MLSQRTHMLCSIFLSSLLVLSFTINIPIFRLFIIIAMCGIILSCDTKMATCHFMFFSSFSMIMKFGNYLMFFLLSISYILCVMFRKGVKLSHIAYIAFLFFYSVMNGSMSINSIFKLGNMIPVIVLIQGYFICSSVDPEDYEMCTNWFIIGFLFSAIAGLFTDSIPLMREVLRDNKAYVYSSSVIYMDLVDRYSGLCFDSNFFGMTSAFCVSIILFRDKRQNNMLFYTIAIALVVFGLATLSKTYIAVMLVVSVYYLFKRVKNPVKVLITILLVLSFYYFVDSYFGLNYISNTLQRIQSADNVAQLTSGRTKIWQAYIQYIFMNGSTLIFGKGINFNLFNIAAHNTYLEFLFKFGAVGLYLWIVFFRTSYKCVKRNTINYDTTSTFVHGFILMVYLFVLSAMSVPSLGVIFALVFFNMNMPTKNKETPEAGKGIEVID